MLLFWTGCLFAVGLFIYENHAIRGPHFPPRIPGVIGIFIFLLAPNVSLPGLVFFRVRDLAPLRFRIYEVPLLPVPSNPNRFIIFHDSL